MYVVFARGRGFFESCGRNGITFTTDFDKAFQHNRNAMNDIVDLLTDEGMEGVILKVID